MAHTEDWNAAYETEPAGSDSPGLGDDEFRDMKRNISERLETEHFFKESQTNDGKHLLGSARAWVTNAEPTTQPNGAAVNATVDTGRIWFNDTNGGVQYYTGANYQYQTYFDTNLEITGTLTVAGVTSLVGDAAFSGDLSVGTNLDVGGTLTVAGVTSLLSDVSVGGDLSVGTNLSVVGTATVSDAVTLSSTLQVAGVSTLASLTVTGSVEFQSGSTFADAVTVDSNLTVTGIISGRKYTSSYNSSTPSEDDIFHALEDAVPNTGDKAVVSGALNISDYTYVISYVERVNATTIGLHTAGGAVSYVRVDVADGDTSTIDGVSLAW